jgi:diadenosine tetraphosphate (Ap4A) HIT family hydrolase
MLGAACAALLAQAPAPNVSACGCDPAVAETMQKRECSLTGLAVAEGAGEGVFFVKDASPRKPNRTLAMPRRVVASTMHELKHLTAAERTALWKAAIAKAKELHGDEWGLAYNGVRVRTQCHLHLHIGKLLRGVDSGKAIFVDRPEDIPAPQDGTGLWIHPVGNRLKVHIEEQICETVLLR